MKEKLNLPLASLQWFFFIFVNTIVVPISIATIFSLPHSDLSAILQTSLLFTGIACILQGLIGHKYPLMEGHSGLMWGLILNLSASAPALGLSLTDVGGGIATGVLLAGAVIIIFSLLNLTSFLEKIFSPMVMTVFLFLLTFHLILTFFKGMLKFAPDGSLVIPVSLYSVFIVIVVSLLKIKGNTFLGNFSVLFGLIIGWILYTIIFPTEYAASGSTKFNIALFPLGKPNLEIGIIVITFLGSMMNLSNTFSSIQAASKMFGKEVHPKQYKRSFSITGAFSIISSIFGLVPYAPFTSAIGFLESTRIFDRKPFLFGGALLSVLGIFPPLVSFLGTMPVTVGNAVLFVAYLQLFGTALKSMNGATFDSKHIFRVAGPVLVGICLMNMNSVVFSSLPGVLKPLLANGLIMGVILSILIEGLINWDRIADEKRALES